MSTTLTPEARLQASALLNRIAAETADRRFHAEDAEALWRLLPPPAPGAVRIEALRAGAWTIRRFRLWLHWVVEVERAGGGPRLRLRYGLLLGAPVDAMRHSGPRLAFRPWPGIVVSLDCGRWRPWKLARPL